MTFLKSVLNYFKKDEEEKLYNPFDEVGLWYIEDTDIFYIYSARMLSDLEDNIRKHEGVRREPYKDSLGNLTTGIGHLITDEDPDWVQDRLDSKQLNQLFQKDLEEAIHLFENIFSEDAIDAMSEPRKAALINMCFNLGSRIKQFTNMIEAVEMQDYEEAGNEMLNSLWAEQVGDRANELARTMARGYN